MRRCTRGSRGCRTTSRATSTTRCGSAARSSARSTGASSAQARRDPPTSRCSTPTSCSASRRSDLRDPVRPARGARPRRRRVAVRRVQAHLRDEPRHRVGVDPRLPRRACSPTPRASCSWRRRRRRPSSSCSRTRPTRRSCSCRTRRATWSGRDYEQAGIIKDGAKMINAVTNSTVPHLTVLMGASYGAGNYGMCGRAYGPRFLFAWPNSKMAVMGPQQLAGVLSIVARQSAPVGGPRVRRGGRRGAARTRRGADRAREPRLLQLGAALRRRHHRPARHAHRARHRPVGRALEHRGGTPRLRRLPDVTMIRRLLIANRAEIAERVIRTARARGTETVAVFSDADARPALRRGWPTRPCTSPGPPRRDLSARRPADRRRAREPAPTPCTPATASSRRTRRFARACEEAGLVFVGPPPR